MRRTHARTEFRTAMLEVTAQAPYDDKIRDRLVEFGDYLFERLREIISAGVNAGEFNESVAPERIAEILTAIITGLTRVKSRLITHRSTLRNHYDERRDAVTDQRGSEGRAMTGIRRRISSLFKGREEFDLTSGDIGKPLFFLSMPIVVTNLFQTAYNLADTFWLVSTARTRSRRSASRSRWCFY